METAKMVHYTVLTVAVAFGITALSAPVCAQEGEDIADIRARAEAGDASAQAKLGGMYMLGLDVAQDEAEAVRWCRLSADQGEDSAQWLLGDHVR